MSGNTGPTPGESNSTSAPDSGAHGIDPGLASSLAGLAGAYASFASLAALLDPLIVGTITRDANGAATSASVIWPDGSAGVYTGTASATIPGAVDTYTVTKVTGGVTTTYTQPAVTRDASTGAVTVRPALTVA